MTIHALRRPVSRYEGLPLHLRPRDRASALVAGLARLDALREEMIAKAIAELDALDAPAEDLEDDEREPDVDGEPSLGWPERTDQTRDRRSRTDHEDEDGGDDEHALGWTEFESIGQTVVLNGQPLRDRIGVGCSNPADGGEPSLGASANVDQRHWGQRSDGMSYDAEDQCEDEGAQCDDEGADNGDTERTVIYMLQHYPEQDA